MKKVYFFTRLNKSYIALHVAEKCNFYSNGFYEFLTDCEVKFKLENLNKRA